jgi:hypothetical protein
VEKPARPEPHLTVTIESEAFGRARLPRGDDRSLLSFLFRTCRAEVPERLNTHSRARLHAGRGDGLCLAAPTTRSRTPQRHGHHRRPGGTENCRARRER